MKDQWLDKWLSFIGFTPLSTNFELSSQQGHMTDWGQSESKYPGNVRARGSLHPEMEFFPYLRSL